MIAILNLFGSAKPGESPIALMPQPQQFTSAELHTISLALAAWCSQNPGMQSGRSAAFKIDSVRGTWHRFVRDNS